MAPRSRASPTRPMDSEGATKRLSGPPEADLSDLDPESPEADLSDLEPEVPLNLAVGWFPAPLPSPLVFGRLPGPSLSPPFAVCPVQRMRNM